MTTLAPAIRDYDTWNTVEWSTTIVLLDAGGTAFDLTSYTDLKMQLRRKASDPDVAIAIALGAGITVVAPATDGRITLLFAQTATAKVPAAAYVYDIRGYKGGGRYDILQRGTIYVADGVTR